MDFVGQKNYEFLATVIYLTEGFVCFCIGFALKDFEIMIKIFFAAGSVTGLLLLPDSKYWPISWAFNRNPHKWLPPLEPEDAPPPPPTIVQKLLKLVGISSGESQSSTEQPVVREKKKIGRKQR